MPLINAEPRIETITERLLIGLCETMCLADNRTPLLWQSFMPRLRELTDRIGTDLYSLQVYPTDYFQSFTPHLNFQKWAATRSAPTKHVPDGMETITISGTYAVFNYQGTPAEFGDAIPYILTQWLPASAYRLDDRPHFEIVGDRYKRNDPSSQEEIWIPICLKE